MATIDKNHSVFTVVIEFATSPEHQGEVLTALRDLADLFPAQPGFVSQHFHRSHDGTRIFNYVQWQSEADHVRCYQNPELKQHGAALIALKEAGKAEMVVRTYEVVHSTHNEIDSAGKSRGSNRDANGDSSRVAATKDLVLTYFQSWQRHDWDTMRACLADEVDLEGPAGVTAMSADAFTDMCKNGSPWRNVQLIDSMFHDSHASLLYEGVNTADDSKVRVGEFVTLENGKVAKLRAAFATGGPPV